MSIELPKSHEESEPSAPMGVTEGDRSEGDLEPVLTTIGGRFWDIPLPPETEKALRTRGF